MTTEQRIRHFIESELLWERTPDDLSDDSSLIESDSSTARLSPRHFASIRALAAFVDQRARRNQRVALAPHAELP